MHDALQNVIIAVDKTVGAVEAGLEEVGARLVGIVVEIEARQRHAVAQAVIDLARIHDGAVDDLGGAEEVVPAVADVIGGVLEEAQPMCTTRFRM